MGRANIDLSWLYPVAKGDSNAQLNPAFNSDINENGDVVNSAGIPYGYDKAGNLVDPNTGKTITDSQFNSNLPYATPTLGQQLFAPQAAAEQQRQNNAWTMAGPEAQHAEDIQRGIYESRFANIPKEFIPKDYTPDNLYGIGYTGRQTPQELNAMHLAASDAASGITPLHSQADIVEAQSNLASAKDLLSRQATLFKTQGDVDSANASDAAFNLSRRPVVHNTTSLQDTEQNVAAKGAINRQPVEEAILDQGAVNRLHSITNVDPKSIELAAKQLTSELGREPREEELREYLLDSKMKEAQISRGLTDIGLQDLPMAQRVAHLQNARSLMEANHMPPMSNSAMIDGNGNIVRNPLGMSTAMQGMYAMQNLPGGSKSALNNNSVINTGTGFNIVPSGTPVPAAKSSGTPAAGTSVRPLVSPSAATGDIRRNILGQEYVDPGTAGQQAIVDWLLHGSKESQAMSDRYYENLLKRKAVSTENSNRNIE